MAYKWGLLTGPQIPNLGVSKTKKTTLASALGDDFFWFVGCFTYFFHTQLTIIPQYFSLNYISSKSLIWFLFGEWWAELQLNIFIENEGGFNWYVAWWWLTTDFWTEFSWLNPKRGHMNYPVWLEHISLSYLGELTWAHLLALRLSDSSFSCHGWCWGGSRFRGTAVGCGSGQASGFFSQMLGVQKWFFKSIFPVRSTEV